MGDAPRNWSRPEAIRNRRSSACKRITRPVTTTRSAGRIGRQPARTGLQAYTLLSVAQAGGHCATRRRRPQATPRSPRQKQRLIQRHAGTATQVRKEEQDREQAKQQAKELAQEQTGANRDESKAAATAGLYSLTRSEESGRPRPACAGRAGLGEHLITNWIGLVDIRQRAALHEAVLGFFSL